MQLEDGSLIHRDKGTPQGGVISPLIANLFLHNAFDTWMQRQYPQFHLNGMPMTGFATVCEAEAEGLRVTIERRLAECVWSLTSKRRRLFTVM